MRVNEMFYSLQGEGVFTGCPAVFVRLAGCNLRCPFCDTDFTSYTEMTEEEIIVAVCKFPARHVVITGGEPSLQLTTSLVEKLHDTGHFVQVETNGTHPVPDSIDWITCSPKEGGELHIQRVDELKVVYQGQDMHQYESIQAKDYSLQPLDTGDAVQNKQITQDTINYILSEPKWRLSLQTHKILNVR